MLNRSDSIHWEANVVNGQYAGMQELLDMQVCTLSNAWCSLPQLQAVTSPLTRCLKSWEVLLAPHPDERFKNFILGGLSKGFHIGYQPHLATARAASYNLLSCIEHPQVVEEYITKECRLERMAGPFPRSAVPQVHISPFGVIPKKATGSWRLIVDLSSPRNHSVNDGIIPEWASLTYISVEMIAERVKALGQGSLLAKVDVKSAFRNIPVHPADRRLLGMEWNQAVYVDMVLPFGLRSAPRLFNTVADALQFIARSEGIEHIVHYLDDYTILGPPGSKQCALDLHLFIKLCDRLGVPLATEKIEGPSSRLEILGIIIDSVQMQLILPERKLIDTKATLRSWRGCKTATKAEIQSLAGTLQHAAKVVRPGRCFVRLIYELTKVKGGPNQKVRINREIRSDIEWWLHFMEGWNGVSLFWKSRMESPDCEVWSDASGSWGCGAFSVLDGRWIQHAWPPSMPTSSIAHKELIPIVMAAFLWGKGWQGKMILFHCDNTAVVSVINKLYCQDLDLMHMVRCLLFAAAKYSFWFAAIHTPGTQNGLADAISRDKADLFLSQAPKAMREVPDQIPGELPQLLFLQQPDWLSASWMKLFESITQQV